VLEARLTLIFGYWAKVLSTATSHRKIK